jgi:hypothetical protein
MRHAGLLLAWLAAGCATTVDAAADDVGEGARDDRPVAERDGGAPRDVAYFDAGAYEIFRDPPCPTARPAPQRAYECEPLRQTGCAVNQGCYVYVDPPAERCGVETYRARCFREGARTQGQFCAGGSECALGFSCFITGAMNRCLRLCRLDGSGAPCERGLVCQPTDLPDFGACN